MLKVENLTKTYSGLKALNNVSFEVKPNEIFSIIGPNGAGKTTLLSLISGFAIPTSGEIFYQSKRITGMKPYKLPSLGIVRTFQIPQPYPDLTVAENIEIGLISSKSFSIEKINFILDFFGLTKLKDMRASVLSVGNLKILEIARAFSLNPKVMLLDEPFGGVSHDKIPYYIEVINKLKSFGLTILLVEHVLKAVMSLSDRILVLNYGEELALGTVDQIKNNQKVKEAYLGEKYAKY